MSRREYLIASPPYVHYCGGINVLHKLCHMLNEKGETAYITGSMNPNYNTISVNTLSQEHLRDLQHNGIIVLPDIVPFNPVRFTNVVRWWLGNVQEPRPNQLTFRFSDVNQAGYTTEHKLSVDIIEDFFCEPKEDNRKGACVYSGKGDGMTHRPIPETGSFNSPNPECFKILVGKPPTRMELADLLKSKEVFYCFDSMTIMPVEARLCGTPVIMVEHIGNVVPPDFYKKSEYGMKGVGFYKDGMDVQAEIKRLKKEIPLFQEEYNNKILAIEKELDMFIEETQKWNPGGVYVEDLDPTGRYLHTLFGHGNFELFRTR